MNRETLFTVLCLGICFGFIVLHFEIEMYHERHPKIIEKVKYINTCIDSTSSAWQLQYFETINQARFHEIEKYDRAPQFHIAPHISGSTLNKRGN